MSAWTCRQSNGKVARKIVPSNPINRWNFWPVGDDISDVEFFIAYEFRSRTLGVLMGTVFETAFRRFSAAFERRADDVYGAHPA